MCRHHRASKKGQGLVEYALILVLVSIAVIIILSLVGRKIADTLCDVAIDLGSPAPDSVAACRAPRITLTGLADNQTVSGTINVEAVVKNNHGLMTSGLNVVFEIDGTVVETEGGWRYCLGGNVDGGPPCFDYNLTGLSSGKHVLHVVATDSSTGLTGESSTSFNIG